MDLGWCKEATNRVLVRSRTKRKDADRATGAVGIAQGVGENRWAEIGGDGDVAGIGDGDAGATLLAVGVGAVLGRGEEPDVARADIAGVIDGDAGVAAVADCGALDPGMPVVAMSPLLWMSMATVPLAP